MNGPLHPRLKTVLDVGAAVAFGAEASARAIKKAVRPRVRGGRKLAPGAGTPLWNELALALKKELGKYGDKARLARLIGVPRQRIDDYLKGNRRLPDAEQTLRLMHWLAERKAGRNPG